MISCAGGSSEVSEWLWDPETKALKAYRMAVRYLKNSSFRRGPIRFFPVKFRVSA